MQDRHPYLISQSWRMGLICIHLIAILFGSGIHVHSAADHAHDDGEHHTHMVTHAHQEESDAHYDHPLMGDEVTSHHHIVSTVHLVGITSSTFRYTPKSTDVTPLWIGLFTPSDQPAPPLAPSRTVMPSDAGLPHNRFCPYSNRAPPA